MNKKIDERQEQEFYKCEHISFIVMFSVSIMVIIIQLLFMKGNLQQVLGETIILMCGGVSMIFGCLKRGLWSYNNNEPSVKSNFIYSIICSLVATLLFVILICIKRKSNVITPITISAFFVVIFILGFTILTLLGQVSQNRKKKIENSYKDI